MTINPSSQPRAINADRDAGLVTIDWTDDHQSVYDATTLRLNCPCAFCQGEAGQPGWLSTDPTLSADQTQLVAMRLIGQYALAPTWGDGHDTGYYTFEALRKDCSCDACTAGRQPLDWARASHPQE